MRYRPHPIFALFALLALLYAFRPGPDLEERDQPLPELPISTLNLKPIDADEMAGEPWLINLWMPG